MGEKEKKSIWCRLQRYILMTEAPPICRNISIPTFISSWLVFHITAKIGLLFFKFLYWD